MRRGWLALVLCLGVRDDRSPRDGSHLELAAPSSSAVSQDIGKSSADPLERTLRENPVRFLEMSLEKCEKEIKSYSLTFFKRERLGGKMQPAEKCEVHYRAQPHSVHMRWIEGARLAAKVCYVEGENDNKVLARGTGLLALAGVVTRDVDGADAKSSGRYTIAQFGFKRSTERTLKTMRAARERGALHVRYEGIVAVPELGDQLCHKIVRGPYEPPEDEALNELTLYFDREHWLQVGSVLKDSKGDLLGEYFFYDIKLNPDLPSKLFTREGL